MSTQVFYPTDPLDGSIAPDTLFMGNDFPPEFLSLAALDKDHNELPMAAMGYQPGPAPETMHMAQAMHQPPTQPEEMQSRPRLRNRALRPAPRDMRKDSMDTDSGMNVQNQPSFIQSYHPGHSFSSFSFNSNSADHDADFTYDNDPHHDEHDPSRISPLSTRSHSQSGSHKSPSPTSLRWHNANGSNDTEKRAKHLERNRAAASKSRQKKKRETDSLRSRFQEASRRKSGLEIEIKDLHSQLLSLKDQILMHSRCDDDAIRVYLGRMVKHATRTDSLSSVSVSSGEVEAESRRLSNNHNHDHDHDYSHSHENEQGHDQAPDAISSRIEMELSNANGNGQEMEQQEQQQNQKIPMRMGDATLPCGIEKNMMGSMFSHGQGNIFDLQMSMT